MWMFAAIASLTTLALWWIRHSRSRYSRLLSAIPGPRGLPLLGNILDANRNTDRIIEYSRELRQTYGRTVVVWSGPYSGVLLCDPRDVEIVLNKTATLSKPTPYKIPQLFLGYSLLTAGRTDWKRFHRIISPAFRIQTLQNFLPAFVGKSKVLVSVLAKHANGCSFDVLKYMMMCTLDVVTQTSLGTSMDILQDNRVELVESLKTAEDILYRTTIRPWCWSIRLMKKTSLYKAMVNSIQVLWDFADNIINQKLSYKSTEYLNGKEDDQAVSLENKTIGFLDHVIESMKTNSTLLTKTELRDNTMTVIVGGMDTAAIVMSAALMLLGLHQDVQKKVVEELQQIFGAEIHRDVTNEDLAKMVYLEQVINETMRLYPPLPFLCRAVEEEVDLTGYTLPAGTIVLLSPFLTHRDAAYFPDPDKFDPDRFSPENSVGRHPYSFFPFLAGRRMCIGKKYAYMQMKTILSTVLRHYQVLPCGSREEMEKVQFRLTLRIVAGSNIKLVPKTFHPFQ